MFSDTAYDFPTSAGCFRNPTVFLISVACFFLFLENFQNPCYRPCSLFFARYHVDFLPRYHMDWYLTRHHVPYTLRRALHVTTCSILRFFLETMFKLMSDFASSSNRIYQHYQQTYRTLKARVVLFISSLDECSPHLSKKVVLVKRADYFRDLLFFSWPPGICYIPVTTRCY